MKIQNKIKPKVIRHSCYNSKAEDSKETINQIRQTIADYMQSEGCNCCRDIEGHKKHEEKLAKLLGVPKYKDGSGYNFNKFAANPTRVNGDETDR